MLDIAMSILCERGGVAYGAVHLSLFFLLLVFCCTFLGWGISGQLVVLVSIYQI